MSTQDNTRTVKEFFAATDRGDEQGLLAVEISTSERREFVAQGDRVVVLGVATGRIKATNKTFVDQFVFAVTVRNGKVSNIREYVDTLALAQASETAAKSRP
jgi:ketosteroid isomerase-like protein